jgi:hypothetical protein
VKQGAGDIVQLSLCADFLFDLNYAHEMSFDCQSNQKGKTRPAFRPDALVFGGHFCLPEEQAGKACHTR